MNKGVLFKILCWLAEHGPARPQEISRIFGYPPGWLSRLRFNGLVMFMPHCEGKIWLSAKGYRLVLERRPDLKEKAQKWAASIVYWSANDEL